MGVRGSALWQGAILLVLAGLFGQSSGCAAEAAREDAPRLGEATSHLASEAAGRGDEAAGSGDDSTGDPEPQPWFSGSKTTGTPAPSPAPATAPAPLGPAADEGDPEPQPWRPPGSDRVMREASPERRAR